MSNFWTLEFENVSVLASDGLKLEFLLCILYNQILHWRNGTLHISRWLTKFVNQIWWQSPTLVTRCWIISQSSIFIDFPPHENIWSQVYSTYRYNSCLAWDFEQRQKKNAKMLTFSQVSPFGVFQVESCLNKKNTELNFRFGKLKHWRRTFTP